MNRAPATHTATQPVPNRAFLRERELAERWGLSPRTLQRWRLEQQGPRFVKFGRSVSYPLQGENGVLDWERRCAVQTSDIQE